MRIKNVARFIVLLLFASILSGVSLSCATTSSSSRDAAACEQALFDAVNAMRQSNGKSPLTRDAYIDGLCRQHAKYMVSRGALSHDYVNTRCNSIYTDVPGMHVCEENVLLSKHLPCDAEHMAQMWFNSLPHKTKMLDAAYTKAGMGVLIDKIGRIWVCQIFAGP